MSNETKATLYTILIAGLVLAFLLYGVLLNPMVFVAVLVLLALLTFTAIAFGAMTVVYDAILKSLNRRERQS